jgi:hypothetical protein
MSIIDNAFINPKPLLTQDSIDWLNEHLNVEMSGIEYGGGASTIWFLKRLKELYTIEANPMWASRLIQEISKNQEFLDKWRLYFVNCNWQIDDCKNRWYVTRALSNEQLIRLEKSYCNFEVKDPDFILVDGAVRYLALYKAVSLLKKEGSILCVDNMELPARERYAKDLIPSTWERIDFPEIEERIPKEYFGHDKHLGKWITSIWIVK